MPTRYYRLTVLGCALSWLIVGLHLPALHEMTHHGRSPHWLVVALTLALVVTGVAGLWVLLRAPAPWPAPSRPPTPSPPTPTSKRSRSRRRSSAG